MKHYKKIELGKIAMLTFAGIINAIGITIFLCLSFCYC